MNFSYFSFVNRQFITWRWHNASQYESKISRFSFVLLRISILFYFLYKNICFSLYVYVNLSLPFNLIHTNITNVIRQYSYHFLLHELIAIEQHTNTYAPELAYEKRLHRCETLRAQFNVISILYERIQKEEEHWKPFQHQHMHAIVVQSMCRIIKRKKNPFGIDILSFDCNTFTMEHICPICNKVINRAHTNLQCYIKAQQKIIDLIDEDRKKDQQKCNLWF